MSHRRLPFASRFFLAPINTGFATDGVPNANLLRFHEERAGHGIGAAYVGNVAISPDVRSNDGTAVLSRSEMTFWQRLTSAIRQRGTVPAIQLACKNAPRPSLRNWVTKDRDAVLEEMSRFVSEMPRSEIVSLCQGFVAAGVLAIDVGFSIVQIHAAHGYLLALLLNRSINRRTDEFAVGGVQALAQIAAGLQARASDVLLDVRVSLYDGVDDEAAERAYRSIQLAQIATAGFDMISLSAGMYDFSRSLIYPLRRDVRSYVDSAVELATTHTQIIWNVAGNLGRIADLNGHPSSNLTFGLGRSLIADPLFVEKSLSGRDAEIVSCGFTGRCHYFSRGAPHLECGVNPSVSGR